MKNSQVILYAMAFAFLIVDWSLMVQPTAMAIQQPSIYSDNGSSLSTSATSLNIIFKNVKNSVVQITYKAPTSSNVSDALINNNNITLGSGFVYDNHGHIITNNHVLGDAKIVDVTFVNGNRYKAHVIGTDNYSDIAVLQIQNPTQGQQQKLLLKPLIIGNSSKLEVGDPVIAIGNPFGLDNTLTASIVNAIGRGLPAAGETGGFSIPELIQTGIPINPGDSGGPLLNIQGQVVGINIANNLIGSFSPDPILGLSIPKVIQTDLPINPLVNTLGYSGSGFAIPSSTITRIVPSLIEKGSYVHPYLGLSGVTLTSDLAQTINGSNNNNNSQLANFKGIYVNTIAKNGPADKAGIHGSTTDQYSIKHGGDIILSIDGHNVTKTDELISYIEVHKSVGNSVILTVYRDGHTLNLKTTLTPRLSSLQRYTPSQASPKP
jgi:S1-C subfamily serine protease